MRHDKSLTLASVILFLCAAATVEAQTNYDCGNYTTGTCATLTCTGVGLGNCPGSPGWSYDTVDQRPLTYGTCYSFSGGSCPINTQVRTCMTIKYMTYGGMYPCSSSVCITYNTTTGC
jgi:hypothetical protein